MHENEFGMCNSVMDKKGKATTMRSTECDQKLVFTLILLTKRESWEFTQKHGRGFEK